MTLAEYQAYVARFTATDEATYGIAVEKEEPLHAAILAECRRRGWIAFHGSMAHSTFRTPGEPDFVIMLDGGKWLAVECKSRTGKLSSEQRAIAAWASKLGHRIYVIRSMDDFFAMLKL